MNQKIIELGELLEAINEEFFVDRKENLENRVEEIGILTGYDQRRQLVKEGILRSYPAESLCKRLTRAYSGHVKNIEFTASQQFDNDLPSVGIAIDAKSNPQMFEPGINRELAASGWFVSTPPQFVDFDFGGGDKNDPLAKFGFCSQPGVQKAYIMWVKARFPIFSENVSAFTKKILNSTDKFYHVSLERLSARVQSVDGGRGLVPHDSKMGDFWYPERNYVFGSKDATIDWINEILSEKFDETRKRNLRRIGNDVREKESGGKGRETAKLANSEHQGSTNWPISVYSVDLKKMVADGHPLRLYRDNNWENQIPAYFTTDIIPQQYLTDITNEIMAPYIKSKK